MLNNILLKYTKNRSKFFSNFFFFLFVIIFMCSVNFLEEDLFIGIFSNLILGFGIFLLKELNYLKIRANRKKLKEIFRIQRNLLVRDYFYFYKFIKINFKYISKITFNYFLIKSSKLFISLNLKLKFNFYKIMYIKNFFFNFIIYFFFKINCDLLDLFFNY